MHKHVTHSGEGERTVGKGLGDNWLELIQDEDTGAASKDQTKEPGISKANHDNSNSNHVFK